MDRGAGIIPMEYEYDNKFRPTVSASPFASLHSSQQESVLNSNAMAKKRGYSSAMSSPTKSQTPSLRQPGPGHSYLFSQRPPSPEKPLPNIPARNPSFNTPRKTEIDFSSGGETPNTPDHQVDSDATHTPDTADRTSSKPYNRSDILREGRRESFTARFFKSLKASPGRGEIPKDVYTKKGERKVHKRRARGPERREHKRRYSVSDSEDDEDDQRHRGGKSRSQGHDQQAPQPPQSTIASILTFIHGHPDLPHIFSYYLQTMLNAFYCLCIIYFISTFWSAIKSDVEKEIEKAAGEILVEMSMCAQQYRENKCERETRVPAMEKACANWETCMNRDPRGVGRAKVSAHTFALIFNSFIEAISWKAMAFTCLMTFGVIIASNVAFTSYRSSRNTPGEYWQQGPPPTPQRHPSGGYLPQQGYWTPYHERQQWVPATEPAPSGHALQQGSPVKKLEWN